ncbi:hypothetical protein L2728_05660 [Shewanella chilikensis]|uniref:hypothetical protein n=1 Tax=Shewanella chilikensis TaxID=558541 RepID=UPI001F463E0D|nr:hypothetical protein [Shewanella chilikensis]MCE9854247.1 hypothetical protein [Shewanella chilikensis]MCL1161374.1 hypothetical protein [Shewanella chilikensis]
MTKKIPQLSAEQLANELEIDLETIARKKALDETGFYKDHEIEHVYWGRGFDYASLGMSYALNQKFDEAKAAFKKAAEYQLRPLKMAFDPTDPEFIGEKVTMGKESIDVVSCFNCAMAAGELAIAKEACLLYPEEQFPGNRKPDTTDDLVHALKAWFNGDHDKASAHCQKRLDEYTAKPSKKITFRSNYFTLHLALWGIIHKDALSFEDGIKRNLAIWHHGARYGEESGTTRGHYAEFAVALTNLGIHAGMEQPVVDPFIPQGLVWVKPD